MDDFNLEKTLSSEYTNISKDLLEVGLDSIMENGVLRDIPVVGTIIGLSKVGMNVRDRIFIKKQMLFLHEASKVPTDKRKKEIDKINQSLKYKTAVGEKLIFIIDKVDDLDKSQMVGMLFVALIEEQVTYEMFLKSTDAIIKVALSDLRWFLEQGECKFSEHSEADSLLNSGILKIRTATGQSTFDSVMLHLVFEVSEVGKCLKSYLRV